MDQSKDVTLKQLASLPVEVVVNNIFPCKSIRFFRKVEHEFLGFGYFKKEKSRRSLWLWRSISLKNFFYPECKYYKKSKKMFFPIIRVNEIYNLEIIENYTEETQVHENESLDRNILRKRIVLHSLHFFLKKNSKIFKNVKLLKLDTCFCKEGKIVEIMMGFFHFPNLEIIYIHSKPITGERWIEENLKNIKKVEMDDTFTDLSFSNFRKNKLFAKYCYNSQFKLIDESLKNDKSFVLSALKTNPAFLESLNQTFKKDKDVVLEAVRNNGSALQYASDSFKKDKDVVFEAVKQNFSSIKFAHNSLRKDSEFIIRVLKINEKSYFFLDKAMNKTAEVVLTTVKKYAHILEYTDITLKNNRNFALSAVKANGFSLEFLGDSFKKDKEIALEAVKKNEDSFIFADRSLKKDKKFVIEAFKVMLKKKSNNQAFCNSFPDVKYLDETLKNDKRFLELLLKEKHKVLLENE